MESNCLRVFSLSFFQLLIYTEHLKSLILLLRTMGMRVGIGAELPTVSFPLDPFTVVLAPSKATFYRHKSLKSPAFFPGFIEVS